VANPGCVRACWGRRVDEIGILGVVGGTAMVDVGAPHSAISGGLDAALLRVSCFCFRRRGADPQTVSRVGNSRERDMDLDGISELQSRDTTSRPPSTKSEIPAPNLLLRHARPRSIGLRVAVSQDGTLKGGGGLGWAR
jgi:hypothetical protein